MAPSSPKIDADAPTENTAPQEENARHVGGGKRAQGESGHRAGRIDDDHPSRPKSSAVAGPAGAAPSC